MHRRTRVSMLGFSALAVACFATNARCQSLDSILNAADKAKLDLSATRVAQKIREAQLCEKPTVLVTDFFRSSVGTSSRLGTLLADRFSESSGNFSRELTVLDRQLLKDYLRREWTTLGDFHSNEASLQLGRDWVRRASSREAWLKKMADRSENSHRRISPVEKRPWLI